MRKSILFFNAIILAVIITVPSLAATRADARTNNSGRTENTAGRDRSANIVNRAANTNVSARRATSTPNVATNLTARSAAKTQSTSISARAGTATTTSITSRNILTARAAASSQTATLVLGDGYNQCRDAYFTCMDQFCAAADDTYRRCICSSRIDEIKNKEIALENTKQQLLDFADLNLDIISKSGSEVKAMLSASTGEATAENTKDTSDSAKSLNGISDILNQTKSNALSSGGKLDIAGDINSIWGQTDLAGGSDLATMSGDKLYNQVHTQCEAAFIDNVCSKKTTLNMVVSAYGMYIENDCNALASNLEKQNKNVQTSIKSAGNEMQNARLENYDAHNSTSINDCIAQVRKDITADTACGENYVHCLDITGQYLNITDGAPIYTENFYQLENMTSLDGDILTNQTNHLLVEILQSKKNYAARGLDTCRDLSEQVWQEFMRQAIAEIYQGQQSAVRKVKDECIDVVNSCYDEQLKNLKDFSNIKEQLLLGQRVELSESMCKSKLDTCSNLYGGGPDGLEELLVSAQNTNTMRIADNCKKTLLDYAKELCSPRASDTAHTYPYACRMYRPGELVHANKSMCYYQADFDIENYDIIETPNNTCYTPRVFKSPDYDCYWNRCYSSCNAGYLLKDPSNFCTNVTTCPVGKCCTCVLAADDLSMQNIAACGTFPNSLYSKIGRYAKDACMRPSLVTDANEYLSNDILMDVNSVMDQIKTDMQKILQQECESSVYGGTWTNTPKAGTRNSSFYNAVSPNYLWGTCKQ